ncbi:MAG: hypothetical protein MAG715_00501 [Methanonatronarchaeales archaeon]|nr:hypothetical protein [Methanonatronarchaeales archaeon]
MAGEAPEGDTPRVSIIVSKGTLNMVFPPLILATTAASMGAEVTLYFTFWGIEALKKDGIKNLKVASVGNPALPMPNILGMLPGMTAIATRMMKGKVEEAGMGDPADLLDMCVEMDNVELVACTPTLGVMGIDEDDLIEGLTLAGAGYAMEQMFESDVQLFI